MRTHKNKGKKGESLKEIFFVFALMLSVFSAAYYGYSDSQDSESPIVPVMVAVSSADKSAESRLEFCIEKDLKNFEDVTIVNDLPEWKLDIIVSRAPVKGSVDSDYTFSVAVLERSNGNEYVMKNHELMVGYPHLQGGCRDIVKSFAVKYLHKDPKKITDTY